MQWYESLMAFVFVMSIVITPAVVIIKRRKSAGKSDLEKLEKRINELESRLQEQKLKLSEQELENNKIKHEIEFMTRLIEQKNARK